MRKRPLATAALIFIIIEIIISGGLKLLNNGDPPDILSIHKNKCKAVVIGTVIKKDEKEKNNCLYLKNVKIIIDDHIYSKSKILAYTGKNQQIKIGNKIKSEMKLEYIKGPRNPGNFDEKKYYELQGISIRGFGKNYTIIDDNYNLTAEFFNNIRLKWKENICEALDEKYSGILIGVLTGDKSRLSKETKVMYSKNGIGHILAISGLHMSFIGMSVYKILRKTNRSFLTSALAGVIILLFYCIITGNSVSSKRALIMYIVRTGAEVTGRTYDMPTSIGIGAMFIVTSNIKYLNDPGFLLSFGALAGLGIVYPCLEKRLSKSKNFKFLKFILPGIAINIISVPVTLYFFYEYPLYSVILNIFIIPLMSLVMIFGITGSAVSLIVPGKYNIFLKLCGGLFFIFDKLCIMFSKLPLWRIITGKISIFWAGVYYLVLIMFLIYLSNEDKSRKIRKNIYFYVPALLVLCLFLSTPLSRKINGKVEITMLDVGQGDGIYIKDHRGNSYFVDGGSTDIKNPGENRIIPFLLSKGVKTLDYCFISHGDNDHKNGIEEILRDQDNTIRIKKIVLPDRKFWDKGLCELYMEARKAGVKVFTFNENTKIIKGNFVIDFIFPLEGYYGAVGNAASMVFKLKYGEFSMLFTGDLEGDGERIVENNKEIKNINILKTAHHGSDGSTSEIFLKNSSPDIALISCGIDNSYGHPGKNTLKRLKEHGIKIYCTNEKGAVKVVTNGKYIKVTSFFK